jgi:hypothetical protein
MTELYLQESRSIARWEDKLIVLNLPWASSGVALASLIIGRTRSNQSLAVLRIRFQIILATLSATSKYFSTHRF